MNKNATENAYNRQLTLEEEIWALFKKIEKSPDEKQQDELRKQIWQLASDCPQKNHK